MPITRVKAQQKYSEQNVANSSYDEDFHVAVTEGLGFDGQALQRLNANNRQIYSIADGGYTYFCFAAPGTALSIDKWMVFRLDSNANLMYADGDADYDNVATDPTILSYSYS